MESQQFERAVVETLVAIIKAKKYKNDPVAVAAWPYKKAAGRAWQAIRSDETAQRLTLRDAYAMTQVLGVSLSQVCAWAEAQEMGAIFPQADTGTAAHAPVQECKGEVARALSAPVSADAR